MRYTATRRFQFCAGHRIYGHESKCVNIHGHNYVAFVTCAAPLDSLGRVIDFSVIKQEVGDWIDDKWDHGMITCEADPLTATFQAMDFKHFVMRENPTAENMAELLRVTAQQLLHGKVEVTGVRLWETENCYAEV